MNIICLLGSPRQKGNSAAIAARFCKSAEKTGASVQTIALNDLTYRGCQGCMACKEKSETCVIKDDLTAVLAAVHNADIVVLTTPVYFGAETSQLKGFTDRTFSYLPPDFMENPGKSRLAPGKKLVFVQTQGDPDESHFSDIYPRYEEFFKWFGFDDTRLIRACGLMGEENAKMLKPAFRAADNAAKELVK